MYLLTLVSPMSMPSFSSSPWMRGAPHPGFSRHILRIRSRISRATTGRPARPRRTFQVQNRRNPLRCQATTVSGLTMASVERQSRQIRESPTHNRRSSGVNWRRFLADRNSTPIWWRRARFSSWRAARERKIEPRAASSLITEMNIVGENYERSIIPVRSDTSGFSTGTIRAEGRSDGVRTTTNALAPEFSCSRLTVHRPTARDNRDTPIRFRLGQVARSQIGNRVGPQGAGLKCTVGLVPADNRDSSIPRHATSRGLRNDIQIAEYLCPRQHRSRFRWLSMSCQPIPCGFVLDHPRLQPNLMPANG